MEPIKEIRIDNVLVKLYEDGTIEARFTDGSTVSNVSFMTAQKISHWSEKLKDYYKKKVEKEFSSGISAGIIKSQRTFGVEIEAFAEFGKLSLLKRRLPLVTDKVEVGSDGSIRTELNGFEARIGVLEGEEGEKTFRAICREINKSEAKTNKSCGLHIHLGANDIKGNYHRMKKTMLFYMVFDDVIMAMLPEYRRGNNYAAKLSHSCSLSGITRARCIEELASTWYGTGDNKDQINKCLGEPRHHSRYYGINMHALLSPKRQTLEIRYHSPTTNPIKILRWISLHQTIMDTMQEISEAEILSYANSLFFEDKLAGFLKLIPLSEPTKNYMLSRIAKFNPKHYQSIQKTLCVE